MTPAVWVLSGVCLPCHFNMGVGYEIVTQWIAPAIPARFAALSGAEGLELDHEVAWTWLRAHFCTAGVTSCSSRSATHSSSIATLSTVRLDSCRKLGTISAPPKLGVQGHKGKLVELEHKGTTLGSSQACSSAP